MKRLIAGLVCALMLSATACAQEYQNVSQLRESAPARWTTTIETKWRGVAIDAKIVTPNVEAIPVVKVGYDLHPSPLTPEESGWMIIDDSYETAGMSIYQDDDLGKPPRKIDGRQVGSMAVPKGAWYDTWRTGSSLYSDVRCDVFGNDGYDFNGNSAVRLSC